MKQFAYFDAPQRGTLRRVDYVGAHGARKYALVYLPHGYETDRERRYDILYLMHGGGGSPDAWPDACPVKNMLDRAFAAGEFLRLNAPRPGAPRFQYLYLEETADWKHQFVDAIKEFFK